jgi:hypothetical protein
MTGEHTKLVQHEGIVRRGVGRWPTLPPPNARRETTEAALTLGLSRAGPSISRSARLHPISGLNGVRSSGFSFPTFPHRTRKDGAPFCLAGLGDARSLDCARDDRFRSGLHAGEGARAT